MLDPEKHQIIKYLLFSSLYFSEGIQLAITTVIVPIFLLEKNLSPTIVTLVAGSIMIPWALKFIFGWIVDSFPQINRKIFALYGGIISATALLFLGFSITSFNLTLFIILLLLAQIGIGLLDVSLDAWAIETTKAKERGKINGSMMAGFFTGAAVGSTILSYIAENNGYTITFIIAGIIILFIMLLPALTKKPINIKRKKPLKTLFIKEFKKKTTLKIALLLPLISINSGLITLATPLFMNITLHLSITYIGMITTMFTVGRIMGSISLGWLSDYIKRDKLLFYVVICSVFSTILLIFSNSKTSITLFYTINGFFNGGLFSILLATSMDRTNIKLGALQFSILISLMNSGELIGELISGSLISLLGFTRLFLFAAWILGPSLLLLFIIIKER